MNIIEYLFYRDAEEKQAAKKQNAYTNAGQESSLKQLLPIGSVVLLKEGDKKLMIFGIFQTNEDDETEEYDYIGVPYPEGNMGDDYQYLFYHKDIEEVFFRGYEDEEREKFVDRLIEYVEEK